MSKLDVRIDENKKNIEINKDEINLTNEKVNLNTGFREQFEVSFENDAPTDLEFYNGTGKSTWSGLYQYCGLGDITNNNSNSVYSRSDILEEFWIKQFSSNGQGSSIEYSLSFIQTMKEAIDSGNGKHYIRDIKRVILPITENDINKVAKITWRQSSNIFLDTVIGDKSLIDNNILNHFFSIYEIKEPDNDSLIRIEPSDGSLINLIYNYNQSSTPYQFVCYFVADPYTNEIVHLSYQPVNAWANPDNIIVTGGQGKNAFEFEVKATEKAKLTQSKCIAGMFLANTLNRIQAIAFERTNLQLTIGKVVKEENLLNVSDGVMNIGTEDAAKTNLCGVPVSSILNSISKWERIDTNEFWDNSYKYLKDYDIRVYGWGVINYFSEIHLGDSFKLSSFSSVKEDIDTGKLTITTIVLEGDRRNLFCVYENGYLAYQEPIDNFYTYIEVFKKA